MDPWLPSEDRSLSASGESCGPDLLNGAALHDLRKAACRAYTAVRGLAMLAHDETGSSTSAGLIARLRTGDASAWDRMVALYSPLVAHWCHKAGLQPDDRADVLQEVFRAVSSGLG